MVTDTTLSVRNRNLYGSKFRIMGVTYRYSGIRLKKFRLSRRSSNFTPNSCRCNLLIPLLATLYYRESFHGPRRVRNERSGGETIEVE